MRVSRWAAVGVLLATGCNQQDAECLGRIGNLLVQRAQSLRQKSGANTRLVQALPELDLSNDSRNLQRRVEEQFLSEPALASLSIRVQAEGGSVRLTGRVGDEEVRRRAVATAQAVVGAGNVIDALEASDPSVATSPPR